MTELSPTEQMRRSSDITRRNRERTEAKRAGRHTIADIKFTVFVVCSCDWRYDGPFTEEGWKEHKKIVGERRS